MDFGRSGVLARMTSLATQTLSPESEAALLRRYREGEVDAFMELYRRLNAPLLAYARTVAPDPSNAEDLVQETFVRLMELDPTIVRESLRAYAYSALRHLAADHARRERVRRVRGPRAAPVVASPVESQDLTEGLALLPQDQREAVVLKIFGGLTLAEVAAVTGTSEATATSRYRYALEKLARFLGKGAAL
jgi:RNA polymerase sigma-70 factor, ECF subfamily